MTISFVAVANSPPPARKRHTLSLSSIKVTWRVVQKEGLFNLFFQGYCPHPGALWGGGEHPQTLVATRLGRHLPPRFLT